MESNGYDIALANFAFWQRQQTEIFVWPEAAMQALRAKLDEIGPGCELFPCFIYSVRVKMPDARIALINREGKEVLS
jgi:hypothetical protein